MNEKKKGFNLLPEYVWMIFVGMLLAILFLSNVIPGRADVGSPTPTVTPVPTSALDPTDACLPIYIMGQTYMLFDEDSSTVLSYFQQYDNNLISRDELLELAYFSRSYQLDNDNSAFFRDVKIALTQLRSQFKGFFVDLIDFGAAKGAYESLYAAVSEVGVPIAQSYGDYSTNRVLYMANGIFIDVPIWVWNTAIPTPTPSPEVSREYVIIKSSSYYYAIFFDYNLYVSTQPLVISGNQNVALTYAVNNYGVGYDFSYPTIIFQSGSSSYSDRLLSLYIPSASSCNFILYSLGESLPLFDYSEIPSHFDPYSMTNSSNIPSKNGSWYYSFNSSLGLNAIGCYKYSNGLSFIDSSLYTYVVGYESSFFTSDFFNTGYNVADNLLTLAYKYGCSSDPTYNPNITPTPGPTATPEPLPTSGESIHVILPPGSPTPTPPFTVSGGSDGTSGSDSPGSIGSGLSSGQTSGVLQAWNMYVSDNPAMLFLTSTFQALPQELLYPLYILLFILLLLAVIRLFVHFSGG